jgi:hypothetical protein
LAEISAHPVSSGHVVHREVGAADDDDEDEERRRRRE